MYLFRFPKHSSRAPSRPRHRARRIERQQRALLAAETIPYIPSLDMPNFSVVLTAEGPFCAANHLIVPAAA